MDHTAADATRTALAGPGRPPRIVPLLNPLARRLLAAGMPMGVNALVTVPGRRSGLPRTTPLAIIEVEGRRWVWSPWGETDWVRNLRAAGHATITVGRQSEEVDVTELGLADRIWFFRDVMGPYARRARFGVWFIRTVDGVDVDQPEAVAEDRRVFELHR
jgi:deazaflavin-dependent oxidoreductase (nitroreductase family)